MPERRQSHGEQGRHRHLPALLFWSYAGRCTSPGIDVAPSNISAFRICSAVGGDWAHARCGTTAYDGKRMDASIVIP